MILIIALTQHNDMIFLQALVKLEIFRWRKTLSPEISGPLSLGPYNYYIFGGRRCSVCTLCATTTTVVCIINFCRCARYPPPPPPGDSGLFQDFQCIKHHAGNSLAWTSGAQPLTLSFDEGERPSMN